MENIVLLIHIILAVVLIIVILIQRAEGGALGIGGGSDGMTPRGTGDALTRITAIIATLFIILFAVAFNALLVITNLHGFPHI